MQRWRGYHSVPSHWGRSVVAIGVFDGVHRGHQQVISHAVKKAAEFAARSVVVTFDPHPDEVVRPGSHPPILTELPAKAELIGALGVDALCVIPFTSEFSQLSGEEFVQDVLVDHLHAMSLVVGGNFRFGRRAAGDVSLLRELGSRSGFEVEEPPLVGDDTGSGIVYSSTYIRVRLAAGDVAAACLALGRPYRLDGVVVRGDGRGRELGFPTANLLSTPHAAIPADGVYVAWLIQGGRRLPAAVSIGANPTFGGRSRRVEAYVLDFHGDLYGEPVGLEFVERLREMRSYQGVEALLTQIGDDVARTREALGLR